MPKVCALRELFGPFSRNRAGLQAETFIDEEEEEERESVCFKDSFRPLLLNAQCALGSIVLYVPLLSTDHVTLPTKLSWHTR